MGTIEEEMQYISKRRNLLNSGSLENQHIVSKWYDICIC